MSTHPKQKEILELLSQIFQMEMSGISRYLHYSFMVMGHHRIPIQGWLRAQATEAMAHATQVGEKITSYGGHPPLFTSPIKETNVHTIDQMLQESLDFEGEAIQLYKKLIPLAGDDMALEDFARTMAITESAHLDEVRKMMKSPQ